MRTARSFLPLERILNMRPLTRRSTMGHLTLRKRFFWKRPEEWGTKTGWMAMWSVREASSTLTSAKDHFPKSLGTLMDMFCFVKVFRWFSVWVENGKNTFREIWKQKKKIHFLQGWFFLGGPLFFFNGQIFGRIFFFFFLEYHV